MKNEINIHPKSMKIQCKNHARKKFEPKKVKCEVCYDRIGPGTEMHQKSASPRGCPKLTFKEGKQKRKTNKRKETY